MMAEEEPALVVWGEFSERFDSSLYMYTFTEFCFTMMFTSLYVPMFALFQLLSVSACVVL